MQQAIVAFHAAAVVRAGQAILFAVPNGEKRDPITAQLLAGSRRARALIEGDAEIGLSDDQAMRPAGLGVLPGANDLVLLLPGARTVLIEVKRAKGVGHRRGYQSRPQRRFERYATALGHTYVVLETVEAYEALLVAEGVELRGTTMLTRG